MTGEELDAYADLDAELDEFDRYLRQREEGDRLARGIVIGVPLAAALWGAGWLLGRLAGWW